ncbi:hypothetical protein C8J57DRAFT_1506037 [Mycena rebaudengoi]|nr:hypothetical protein C8J57DRAFT_1506037 [Mycena rebaudengoi]
MPHDIIIVRLFPPWFVGELSPTAALAETIEYKRRQNTIAARKSRKRKLEHQRALEGESFVRAGAGAGRYVIDRLRGLVDVVSAASRSRPCRCSCPRWRDAVARVRDGATLLLGGGRKRPCVCPLPTSSVLAVCTLVLYDRRHPPPPPSSHSRPPPLLIVVPAKENPKGYPYPRFVFLFRPRPISDSRLSSPSALVAPLITDAIAVVTTLALD